MAPELWECYQVFSVQQRLTKAAFCFHNLSNLMLTKNCLILHNLPNPTKQNSKQDFQVGRV